MEQIKVNMIPNGEVKTIHCSKGDGKTRKWGFELYKEDGVIPASSISPQMFFGSYKGGTEEVLPENGSEPTTSPIIADIQYPDALRSEQEFLYRESPSTVDGSAKINRIKGNTVVFNQLVQNGNFADTSNWAVTDGAVTFSVSGNVGSIAVTTGGNYGIKQAIVGKKNHSVLLTFEYNAPSASVNIGYFYNNGSERINFTSTSANTWVKESSVITLGSNYAESGADLYFVNRTNSSTLQIRNVMIVDLTAINNSFITDASSFRSYYNLPYYDYTQGKLLPFKGEELKTTGKNLFNPNIFIDEGFSLQSDGSYYITGFYHLNNVAFWENKTNHVGSIYIKAKLKYESSSMSAGLRILAKYTDGTTGRYYTTASDEYVDYVVTTDASRIVKELCWDYGTINNGTYFKDFMISFSDISYEPYTTSTLSLPISAYFPTGMKDCSQSSQVFDEKTESKAITRVGSEDLGTLNWSYNNNEQAFVGTISLMKRPSTAGTKPNIVCSIYGIGNVFGSQADIANANDKTCYVQRTTNILSIKDALYGTDANAFKQAMSGQYLYFELATPTETTINTASLVSEQGEIPLYNDNGVLIGECTEQISSQSGFLPTKIMLNDNGVAYSQKINLHVEQ